MKYLLALIGLVVPGIASAQAPVNPCPVSFLPCSGGGGSDGLVQFVIGDLMPPVYLAFMGMMMLFFVWYTMRLLLESGEENALTEAKQAYGYAITGAILVSAATLIVQAFGPDARDVLIEDEPVNTLVGTIIRFLKILTSTAVTVLIVVQGIRLIVVQDQSELDNQKKRFFQSLIGVVVVLLAEAMIRAVMPGSNSGIIAAEVRGIINFVLELLGVLIVLGFIVAGTFMIFATDDGLKDRAKRAIFATLIAIIVVFCAYVIVNFVLTL